jgi:hypothetical protein
MERAHVGEAPPERPLDGRPPSRSARQLVHGTAQPPPLHGAVPRSFAHANYLGLNLRGRGRPSQVASDNDVDTREGTGVREVPTPGGGGRPLTRTAHTQAPRSAVVLGRSWRMGRPRAWLPGLRTG